jgi:hypothetical protein
MNISNLINLQLLAIWSNFAKNFSTLQLSSIINALEKVLKLPSFSNSFCSWWNSEKEEEAF